MNETTYQKLKALYLEMQSLIEMLPQRPNLANSVPPSKEWLTDDDLVLLFNTSKRTLSRWRKCNYIPYTRIGKTPIYNKYILYTTLLATSNAPTQLTTI